MYSINETAAQVGIAYWRIRFAVTTGKVTKPTLFCGRYLFTDDDVANLKCHFEKGKHDDKSEDIEL